MTLTIGTGPFGPDPAGQFNFTREGPRHVLYWEDSPRHVRVAFGGETVAGSRRVKLLHETGLLPVYYFPVDDVRTDLLEPTDRSTHCPFKGDAAYWSVRVGDTVATNAVWGYDDPLEDAPALAGYRAFHWDRMDAWYEEDEEVFVHPRDPYHRVDVIRSSRHVQVSLDGEELAKSDRPTMLFETGLPPRYYLPREDVRTDLLRPSETATRCPYKGVASYDHLELDRARHEDFVWHYPEPARTTEPIRDLLCFYNEKVDLVVDGEALPRPQTKFS